MVWGGLLWQNTHLLSGAGSRFSGTHIDCRHIEGKLYRGGMKRGRTFKCLHFRSKVTLYEKKTAKSWFFQFTFINVSLFSKHGIFNRDDIPILMKGQFQNHALLLEINPHFTAGGLWMAPPNICFVTGFNEDDNELFIAVHHYYQFCTKRGWNVQWKPHIFWYGGCLLTQHGSS